MGESIPDTVRSSNYRSLCEHYAEITSLADAVSDLVNDGDTVALEGFTHLIPVAAGQEIIRQRKRDLTLVRMTPDIVYDQLIGAGCARKLIFSWGGNPGVGSLHRFREAVQTHELEIEEHSHAGMANRYVAAASDLPFAVMRGYNGTSLPEHTDTIKPIACPFTGEWLTAVPALDLDVGIIHAQQADKQGNVQLWGQVGVQKETVLGAKRSLVTVEEIVDELEPRPNAVVLPRWVVTRVVARARRRQAVLRAGLLRPRQRGLPRVGRGLQGQGEVRRLAGGAVSYEADEMMSIAAARALRDVNACFVGIGLPSTGANLARRTHAPDLVLVYEAGAIGAKPPRLPLSIGDGMLGETADAIVARARDVQLLGPVGPDRRRLPRRGPDRPLRQHQHDRDRRRLRQSEGAPARRRRGAGDRRVLRGGDRDRAPEHPRAFVEKVDFITSVGHGSGPGERERLGLQRQGADEGHHRPRHPRARPRDQGARAHARCTRASPPSRPRRRPAGS